MREENLRRWDHSRDKNSTALRPKLHNLGPLYTIGEKLWRKLHKGHGSLLRSQTLNLTAFGCSVK